MTLTVRDIMTTDLITVAPTTSVQDITALLRDKRISGLPVVDEESHLLGMVTESDLVVRVAGPHIPAHIELLGSIIYLERPHDLNENLRKALGVTAQEIMSADVVTTDENKTLREVAELMMNKHVNRLPVIRDGRLVGIITRHDVISTLA